MQVAMLLRTSKGQVRMASAKGVRELTGFEIGAVPPFGHLQPIPTLVDSEVFPQALVLGRGKVRKVMHNASGR